MGVIFCNFILFNNNFEQVKFLCPRQIAIRCDPLRGLRSVKDAPRSEHLAKINPCWHVREFISGFWAPRRLSSHDQKLRFFGARRRFWLAGRRNICSVRCWDNLHSRHKEFSTELWWCNGERDRGRHSCGYLSGFTWRRAEVFRKLTRATVMYIYI